jgi:hypothetical protein
MVVCIVLVLCTHCQGSLGEAVKEDNTGKPSETPAPSEVLARNDRRFMEDIIKGLCKCKKYVASRACSCKVVKNKEGCGWQSILNIIIFQHFICSDGRCRIHYLE